MVEDASQHDDGTPPPRDSPVDEGAPSIEETVNADVDAPSAEITDGSADDEGRIATDAAWPTSSIHRCGMPAPLPPGICPAASCGNGVVDSCHVGDPHADGGDLYSEECDGTNLAGRTCAGVGFARGTLACAANCIFDALGCESCARGPRTVVCARPDLGGASPSFWYYLLALAATDTEIGVAWLEDGQWIHFTRLGPDLTVLSDTACFGSPLSDSWQLALAATPTGWLIAANDTARSSPIDLFAIDAVGELRSSKTTATQASNVYLFPRPGSAPLLVWIDGAFSFQVPGTLHAQLLNDDGDAVSGEARIDSILHPYVAGVFVGDGFELMAATGKGPDGGYFPVFQVVHLGLDLAVRTDVVTGLALGEAPSIDWTGSEVQFAYTGCDELITDACRTKTFVERITAGGTRVGARTEVPIPGGYFDSAVAEGTDTVILYGVPAAKELLRIDPMATTAWTSEPVWYSPQTYSVRMVKQRDDVVIAWFSARLELARIRVAP